jgi:predicted HicB family RNase H-like nuclease
LKKLVTFRLDPELLAKAKVTARQENRTLTNFVETVLKQALGGDRPQDGSHANGSGVSSD